MLVKGTAGMLGWKSGKLPMHGYALSQVIKATLPLKVTIEHDTGLCTTPALLAGNSWIPSHVCHRVDTAKQVVAWHELAADLVRQCHLMSRALVALDKCSNCLAIGKNYLLCVLYMALSQLTYHHMVSGHT